MSPPPADRQLSGMEDLIHDYFSAKHAAREQSLGLTRLVIRHAGNAIRAVHRRDFEAARLLLEQSAQAAVEARERVLEQPGLLYGGYLQDAFKELAEATLFLALVQNHELPTPQALELGWEPYLAGLAETVGELRRYALDALRHGETGLAEAMLGHMSAIYELLITVDYPDAVTGSLRHATDSARAILERTRGDITVAVQQQRLES
ncbi:MAG TPA: haloacid dehalogenase, partial [Chloroflexota bacterium]|nr:haloacid dehalogenase [Chloroflexota bacterium]